jgi:hypothetical protein
MEFMLALVVPFQQPGSMIKMDVFGFPELMAPIFGKDRFPGAFSSAGRGQQQNF